MPVWRAGCVPSFASTLYTSVIAMAVFRSAGERLRGMCATVLAARHLPRHDLVYARILMCEALCCAQEATKTGRLAKASLGHLIECFCSMHTEKGHATADWRQRPLPFELLRYSVLDALCLPAVAAALLHLLAEGAGEEAAVAGGATPSADCDGACTRRAVRDGGARGAATCAQSPARDAEAKHEDRAEAADSGTAAEPAVTWQDRVAAAWARSQKVAGRVHQPRTALFTAVLADCFREMVSARFCAWIAVSLTTTRLTIACGMQLAPRSASASPPRPSAASHTAVAPAAPHIPKARSTSTSPRRCAGGATTTRGSSLATCSSYCQRPRCARSPARRRRPRAACGDASPLRHKRAPSVPPLRRAARGTAAAALLSAQRADSAALFPTRSRRGRRDGGSRSEAAPSRASFVAHRPKMSQTRRAAAPGAQGSNPFAAASACWLPKHRRCPVTSAYTCACELCRSCVW